MFVITYEIPAFPSDVIVEIHCRNNEEATSIYEERISRGTLKNVKLVEDENLFK